MEPIIRPMRESDLVPLHRLLSDPKVMQYLEPPFTKEQTAHFLKTAGLSDPPPILAVERDGRFIGYVIFHPYDEYAYELGWVLSPDVWGCGIASALTERLMERCRALRTDAVLECDPNQSVTVHIAEKLGFILEEQTESLLVYRKRLIEL